MSVVLVVLPGAPGISEETQKKDRELNSYLENKVQGNATPYLHTHYSIFSFLAEMLSINEELTIAGIMQALAFESIDSLPPGGGIEGK